jgi:hypothetical protein
MRDGFTAKAAPTIESLVYAIVLEQNSQIYTDTNPSSQFINQLIILNLRVPKALVCTFRKF